MSLLPCNRDPVALRVVDDEGFWNIGALREHVKGCELCECVHDAFTAMTGSRGGAAGRGASKRRGDSNYYRALAGRARRRKALRRAVNEQDCSRP